jgi:hypothetical protein
MKALKISLAITVVAAIVFFIIRSSVITSKAKQISSPKSQFTELIEKEIVALGNSPDNKFCKDKYNEVKYLIDDYYKPHPPQYPYGRFGKSQAENDQWKENLTKNLYSIYAEKFISQAFFVFRGSEWRIDALKFIRNEYQILRRSDLLEKGGPVDEKFAEIQTILNKYNEIDGFISGCNGFSYSASSLSDRFPLSDVQGKISQAATYRNNQMGNTYVNNCRRLQDGLKEIPEVLFKAHVRYLDNKINQWSGLYSNYNSQSDYANNLYKPLKSEIDALDSETYNVTNFDSEYERLSYKWSADNIKAFNFKFPTRR